MQVDENKAVWDGKYHWADQGDEWSEPWGGVANHWYGSILPRILPFVPVQRMVEIACGQGRITQFLKELTREYIGIDLSEQCIETCRSRFRDNAHMTFAVNDGKSLEAVPDGYADLVFSFDSLVHVDPETMSAYVHQLPRVLSDEGVAILHHSNVGAYDELIKKIRRVPKLYGGFIRLGLLEKSYYWRDPLASARSVAEAADAAGLHCVAQELVRWRESRIYCDAFTVIARKNSRWAKSATRIWRNPDFSREAANLARIASHYRGA
ncbi:MAG TPA: class I SAM-dependent methyltransferase [Kiritimatiellia bacterium]|nr:class I SAM-dependent methyltransferase [Kiritimatiellia bacterium]HMO98691.1 class I SAM-dependent methyltransferase [Kiritimatiellia bacterium]